MGMYTCLGVKGTIKPEYRAAVAKWLADRGETAYASLRQELVAVVTAGQELPMTRPAIIEDLDNYRNMSRCDWVPFAGVEHSILDNYGWAKHQEYDQETGQLCFTCSVKNYEQICQYFLTLVGWHLFESVDVVQMETDPAAGFRVLHTLLPEEFTERRQIKFDTQTVDLYGPGSGLFGGLNDAPAENPKFQLHEAFQ